MTFKIYTFLLSLMISGTIALNGQTTFQVPGEFDNINDAISAAESGDTILVAPGTYVENIIFGGKDIYLTSEFLFTQTMETVEQTIIDGSEPTDPDFGSVVRIVDGETENAVLQGFTITGGSGSRTYAENTWFRTGGGISTNNSSPTIINNIIRDNTSIPSPDVSGAGGGGIRVGFGTPYIANNYITGNSGGYAGGIMVAFCQGMTIENNVITYNHTDGDFGGGGGIYVDWESINIINNTIANNDSDGTGGGLCITGNASAIKNCIIYGNSATDTTTNSIRRRFSGNPVVTYSNVMDGHIGTGNISEDPQFVDQDLYELSLSSPCVDAGNPAAIFNDQVDTSGTMVLFPAKGTSRNDMGAHGGPRYLVRTSMPVSVSEIATDQMETIQAIVKGDELCISLEKNEHLMICAYDTDGRMVDFLFEGNLELGEHQFTLKQTGFQIIALKNKHGKTKVLKCFVK